MAKQVDKKIAETDFLKVKRVLQQFQLDRLSADYADLRRSPEWRPLTEYFINEVYCPKDFTERNTKFKWMTSVFKSSLGKKVFRDLVFLMDLHALTEDLDNRLVEKLIEIGAGNKIMPSDYDRAYRLCDNYAERKKQLDMLVKCFHNTHQISKHWYIGLLIRSAKLMAGILTPSASLISLEKAYSILRDIKDIHVFTDRIYNNELERLNRIYEKH